MTNLSILELNIIHGFDEETQDFFFTCRNKDRDTLDAESLSNQFMMLKINLDVMLPIATTVLNDSMLNNGMSLEITQGQHINLRNYILDRFKYLHFPNQ